MDCCICSKPAEYSCKSCEKAFYCGEECQTIDWQTQHQHVCSTIGAPLIGSSLSDADIDSFCKLLIHDTITVKRGEVFELSGFDEFVLPAHWFIRQHENKEGIQYIEKISEEKDGKLDLIKGTQEQPAGVPGFIYRAVKKILPTSGVFESSYPVKFRLRAGQKKGEFTVYAYQKNLLDKTDSGIIQSRLYMIKVV